MGNVVHRAARAAIRKATVLLAAGTLVVAFAACGTVVSRPPVDRGGSDRGAAARLPSGEDAGVDSGLETAVFRRLPAEVTGYLADIAAAFSRRDKPFLLSQGEAAFTAWSAAALESDDEILGHLFRTGSLAEDEPAASPHDEPRLAVHNVQGITYLGWAERGPFIEVRAHIVITGGGTIPARLLVIWKLAEPKLQGYMR